MLLIAVSGCGLPTWNELIGAKPAPIQPPPQPVVAPPIVTPIKPPAPPPKPNPDEVIARFQKLKPYEVDDKALGSLLSLDEGLEAVTELDLKGSHVSDSGLAQIGKLNRLAKLDVRGGLIGKDAAASIAQAASLEELRLPGTKFDQASLEALRQLGKLKLLDLTGVRLPRGGFAELLYHRELVELDLRDSSMDDASLEIVADLPDLVRIWLGRTQVTDFGIAKLGQLHKLDLLELTDCRVTGEAFAVGGKNKGFHSLRELYLRNTPLSAKGALAVKGMKQLDSLDLGDIRQMNDNDLFAMIRALENLRVLRLVGCSALTSKSMMALKNSKSIEQLDLSNCPRIDDSVLTLLVSCKNLKWLNIANTNCSRATIERFRQMLPECEVVGG